MRVTIIVPDNIVQVDGLALVVTLPSNLGNLHAIQLYDDGHIEAEYTNAKITDPTTVATMMQPFLDAFNAAKAARDAAVSAQAAEAVAQVAAQQAVASTGTQSV